MIHVKCTSWIACAVVLVASAGTVAAPRPDNPFTISGRPAQDRQMLADMAAMDLSKVAQSDAIWAVTQITLDPNSNIPHGRMVPETGPEAKLVVTVFVKGQCKVLAKLVGDCGKDEWSFEWTPRHNMSAGATTQGRRLQIFREGVMLVRIDPKAVGEDQFPEFYELPDKTWAHVAHDALEQYRKHPDWFAADQVAKNKDELTTLALGENPLLVMLAFRLLSDGDVTDAALVQKTLANAPFPTQAVLLKTILESKKDQDTERASPPIHSVIDAATKVEDVEGLVVAATFVRPANRGGRNLTARVISDVEKRLGELKGSDEVRQGIKRMIEIYKLGVMLEGSRNTGGTGANVEHVITPRIWR